MKYGIISFKNLVVHFWNIFSVYASQKQTSTNKLNLYSQSDCRITLPTDHPIWIHLDRPRMPIERTKMHPASTLWRATDPANPTYHPATLALNSPSPVTPPSNPRSRAAAAFPSLALSRHRLPLSRAARAAPAPLSPLPCELPSPHESAREREAGGARALPVGGRRRWIWRGRCRPITRRWRQGVPRAPSA
jgi:hypothetical protein